VFSSVPTTISVVAGPSPQEVSAAAAGENAKPDHTATVAAENAQKAPMDLTIGPPLRGTSPYGPRMVVVAGPAVEAKALGHRGPNALDLPGHQVGRSHSENRIRGFEMRVTRIAVLVAAAVVGSGVGAPAAASAGDECVYIDVTGSPYTGPCDGSEIQLPEAPPVPVPVCVPSPYGCPDGS
jgi:hypothetical protein